MSMRSMKFMQRGGTLLRTNYMVDITTIRDRVMTEYSTVQDNIPCNVEPTGSDIQYHAQFGAVAVEKFWVFLPTDTPVAPLDLVLVDGVYYECHSIEDYSYTDWHIRVQAVKKNYQRQ